jgi:pyridoxamine 5'-phosphate oxidase
MSLRRADVAADPLEQFRRWFADAREAVPVPEAMAIATATPDGAPSVRMVLLKRADEDGFVFHTSYGGRKGRELAANPRAALLFHWAPQGRQLRVEGPVERVSREESEAYFRTRAPKSRISALVSPQSQVVPDRETLERWWREAEERYGDDPPLPGEWGGFRVRPDAYEFWQHRDDRLHDRLRYRREGGAWVLERLAP